MCKHERELKKYPSEQTDEAYLYNRCTCGFVGCCSIDVYEHMLEVGVNILKGSKYHAYAPIEREQ